MKYVNSNDQVTKLIKKLVLGLNDSSEVSPWIIFWFILIKEFSDFSTKTQPKALFVLCLIYTLITMINTFYPLTASLLQTLGSWNPFNLLFGILGANTKSKLLTFVFLVVYYLPFDGEMKQLQIISILIISLVLCFSIYIEFIFSSIETNIYYFAIFFSTFSLTLYKTFEKYFIGDAEETLRIEMICILPVLMLVGYIVMKIRTELIISNPQTGIELFISILHLKKSENKEYVISKLAAHKELCNDCLCFCQKLSIQKLLSSNLNTSELNSLVNQYIDFEFRKYFEKGLSKNLGHSCENLRLMKGYIEFLIERSSSLSAFLLLVKVSLDDSSLFIWNGFMETRMKLEEKYSKNAYFDKNMRKISLFQVYDQKVSYVIKEIREILEEKIYFWTEVCKEYPMLMILEKRGRKIVKKIESLHKYFTYEIKPCEETLSYFKCTLIYASYLSLTTNYTEFSNSLTKKVQKYKEDQKGRLGNHEEFGLFLEVVENCESQSDHKFELHIKNISKSLCLLLRKEKKLILNSNLTQLLPEEFIDSHNKEIDNWIIENTFESSKIAMPFFMSNYEIELPFKVDNESVVFLGVQTSLNYNSLENKFMIQSVLKKIHNNSIHFIMNLKGQTIYKETSLFEDFAKNEKIKQNIDKISLQFKETGNIEIVLDKFEDEEHIFEIKFQPLMIKNTKEAIIQLTITSDFFKAEKNRFTSNHVNNWKNINDSPLSHKETDSQTSTTSRKESIENVLNILIESNSLKIECFLTFLLGACCFCAVVSVIFVRFTYRIWETENYLQLPTFTLINFVNLKTISNTVVAWRYDTVKQFSDSESMQKQLFNLYQGVSLYNIRTVKFRVMFEMQSKTLYSTIFSQNNEVTRELKHLFKKKLLIENPRYQSQPKNMTLQSIFINYLLAIQHINRGYDYDRLILSFSYLSTVYHEITQITNQITNDLYTHFSKLKKYNILIICLAISEMLIFLLPLHKFNLNSKKKTEKVYNLLVALDSKIVVNELNKLMYLECESFAQWEGKDSDKAGSTQIHSAFGGSWRADKNEPYEKNPKNEKKDHLDINFNNNYINGNYFNGDEMTKTRREDKKSNKNFVTMQQLSFSKSSEIEIRKRGGDLNLENSQCDPRRFLLKDHLSLFFILTFITLFLILFFQKLELINKVEKHFTNSLGILSTLEEYTITVLNTKIYVDEYSKENKKEFRGIDLEEWIYIKIKSLGEIGEFTEGNEAQIRNCTSKILVCTQNFSSLLRESLIKKSISDSFGYKRQYMEMEDTGSEKEKEEIYNFLEKSRYLLSFAQQVLDYMALEFNEEFMSSFAQMQKERENYGQREWAIFVEFMIVAAIFIIFSVAYTIYRKKEYVLEVSLLSILNKEMLYNNKSVESFVHRLAKSLR